MKIEPVPGVTLSEDGEYQLTNSTSIQDFDKVKAVDTMKETMKKVLDKHISEHGFHAGAELEASVCISLFLEHFCRLNTVGREAVGKVFNDIISGEMVNEINKKI